MDGKDELAKHHISNENISKYISETSFYVTGDIIKKLPLSNYNFPKHYYDDIELGY